MARTYDLELSLPIHAQKKEDGKRNHQLLKQALSSDLIILLEKVYITPSSMGVDYITPQPMKRSILSSELSKTD